MLSVKNRFLPLFFLFLLLISGVNAELYHFEMDAEIYENLTAICEYRAIYLETNRTTLTIYFESPVKSILGYNLPCIVEGGQKITCSIPQGKRVTLKVFVLTSVKKLNESFIFENNFRLSQTTKEVVVLVKLPEGAVLAKNKPFFPKDGSIGTDGRRIFIVWKKTNLGAGEIYGVKLYYEFPKKHVGEVEKKEKIFEIALILSAIIPTLTIFVYLIYFKRKKVEKVVLPLLREDEKKVMKVILANPRGVNQKVIVEETGYSKAKVSKVLKSLEERGLIRIERRGRTNKVYLKKPELE